MPGCLKSARLKGQSESIRLERPKLLHCAMASGEKDKKYEEGPDAAARFESSLHHILKVSKPELDCREAVYRKARRLPRKKRARSS